MPIWSPSRHRADDPGYRFDLAYKTGLLDVLGVCGADAAGGHRATRRLRPEDLRLGTRGRVHVALLRRRIPPPAPAGGDSGAHEGPGGGHGLAYYGSRAYRFNGRNFGYVAARHLRPRDAFETLVALLATNVRHAIRIETAPLSVVKDTIAGFIDGLRHREASHEPAGFSRLPAELQQLRHSLAGHDPISARAPAAADPANPPRAVIKYYERRARYYPDNAATLRF